MVYSRAFFIAVLMLFAFNKLAVERVTAGVSNLILGAFTSLIRHDDSFFEFCEEYL
jgi:hypothetical protein